jgi:hypothetical protein
MHLFGVDATIGGHPDGSVVAPAADVMTCHDDPFSISGGVAFGQSLQTTQPVFFFLFLPP